MTAHELAKKLLEGPDDEVVTFHKDPENYHNYWCETIDFVPNVGTPVEIDGKQVWCIIIQ